MNDWRTEGRGAGAFAAVDGRWRFAGVLTFDDAATVLADTEAMPLPASGKVDMAALEHADSAALAVMLALQRRATAEGMRIAFTAMPPMLQSLARVYGLEDQFAP